MNTEMTSQQKGILVHESIILVYKLINTFQSPSFAKSLSKPWRKARRNVNIEAINNKAVSEIIETLVEFKRNEEFQTIYDYIDQLSGINGYKIKQSEKKGLLTSMNDEEYGLVSVFLCELSNKYRPVGKEVRGQFLCHNMFVRLAHYLYLKDGVENGTGLASIDKVFNTLLKTKDISFFDNGHVNDLLVLDRAEMKTSGKQVKYIRCRKSFLSTRQIKDANYVEKEPEHFELYKVA
jgi:hypothetical protein